MSNNGLLDLVWNNTPLINWLRDDCFNDPQANSPKSEWLIETYPETLNAI